MGYWLRHLHLNSLQANEELSNFLENGNGLPWNNLGEQLTLGTLIGLAIGFAFKKAIKILLFMFGILALFLLFLETNGFVEIHWVSIEGQFQSFMDNWGGMEGLLTNFFKWVVRSIPLAGSIAVGFLIGYRWG